MDCAFTATQPKSASGNAESARHLLLFTPLAEGHPIRSEKRKKGNHMFKLEIIGKEGSA